MRLVSIAVVVAAAAAPVAERAAYDLRPVETPVAVLGDVDEVVGPGPWPVIGAHPVQNWL